jgi:predicted N-formylglutamate amidohydrolase
MPKVPVYVIPDFHKVIATKNVIIECRNELVAISKQQKALRERRAELLKIIADAKK